LSIVIVTSKLQKSTVVRQVSHLFSTGFLNLCATEEFLTATSPALPGSGVASPKILGGPKCLNLGE